MTRSLPAIASIFFLCAAAGAAEPNDTFNTATILPRGIRKVVDELTLHHVYPDTLLGIRDSDGEIGPVNDDNSRYGDGFASGLQGLPVDAESIRFAVTGFGDENFSGDHDQFGQYEVFVDVFNNAAELIDGFSEIRTLMPGTVHEYAFMNSAWLGGTYDVNINNINGANDVDFFTFQGLTPGATFTAKTFYIDTADVDTVLGWYDAIGNLLTYDDDGGGNTQSQIQGIVPLSGSLTFAVTGFGDFEFDGSHSQDGNYELLVTQSAITTVGDYNGNGIVDAADYTVWRNTLHQSGPGLAADGDPNGQIDALDYAVWKSHFGNIAGESMLTTDVAGYPVPEPLFSQWLILAAAALFAPQSRRKMGSHTILLVPRSFLASRRPRSTVRCR